MLDLLDEKLDIKFKGETFSLEYPTNERLEKFQKDSVEMSATVTALDLIKGLLSDCGLSEENYKKMNQKHINAIFNDLLGIKKN
jgi:hypothetical protein